MDQVRKVRKGERREERYKIRGSVDLIHLGRECITSILNLLHTSPQSHCLDWPVSFSCLWSMNDKKGADRSLKAVCSVTEQCRALKLSHDQFYNLQNMGIFPKGLKDERTGRPYFDMKLQ